MSNENQVSFAKIHATDICRLTAIDHSQKNALGSMSNESTLLLPAAQVLPDLPTEVLMQIAESAEKKDLINFRLVCKTWKGAATKTFTKLYFSKRYHSMSSYSIEVLESIAAHPEFGPYLDTIVICILPYQVEDISDNQASSDDDSGNNLWIRISDNVFSDSMERIFGTIKRHRLSVAIGISDRLTINFKTDNIGHEASVLDENTRHQIRAFGLCRPSKPPHRCYGASLPRDESILMEPMLAAAEKSGCLVHGLLLKAGNHISWSALSNLVGGYLLKRIGFAIDVEDGVFDHFRYNHATSYLELACRSFYNRGFASKTNSPMESWLLQVKVTRLRLQECEFVEDTFMAHQSEILSRHSRSLKSIDIRHGWMLNQGDWGVIFNYLSRLPNLRHCCLAQLTVSIHTPDQEQDDRLLFLVYFPNNTSMIDLYGDKMCSKLQDFAACLASHRIALAQGDQDFKVPRTCYRRYADMSQKEKDEEERLSYKY